MSRGHGKVERAILDALAPAGAALNSINLALIVFPDKFWTPKGWIQYPYDSARESVRRALRKLKAEGLLQREDRKHGRWYRRGTLGEVLEADAANFIRSE